VVSRRILVSVAADHVNVGVSFCAFLGFAVLGFLAWVLWRRRRTLPGGIELMAAGLLTMAASFYKMRFDTWNLDDLYNGDRYMFAHKVLLVWVVAAIAATCGSAVRWLIGAGALAAFLVSLPRFLIPGYPDLHWGRYVPLIERGERVVVPILPEGDTLTYHGGRPPNP
jgi:energy-coupling factor transporter transmembrane protein EcfT